VADQMRNGIRQRYYEDVDASALSNIERVEVLKGPSGVLFGQSGVGGIISIITKQPQQAAAANVALTMGNYNQKMLTADVTGPLSDTLAVRVTGEVEQSGTFVDFQDIGRLNGALSLRYTLSDKVTAYFVAEYVDRQTSRYPGLPVVGTVVPNGVGTVARWANLGEPAVDSLSASAPLLQFWVDVKLSDNWTLTPRLQYQEFNSSFVQIRLRSPQADLVTINRNGRIGKEDDEYYIGQLDLTGRFKTGPITHELLVGFEGSQDRSRFTQRNLTNVTPINALAPVYNFDSVAPTSTFAFDSFYNIDGAALFLQDQIALTTDWNLIGALRHSWFDASDGDFGGNPVNQADVQANIWQIGTTYKLTDAVSFFAGYNTGFDIESTAGARTADGTPLRPERSDQVEVGMRYGSDTLRGSIAVFQIQRTDALTTDPANPDFSINAGEQRVRGFEIEGEWLPRPWWSVTAGYAYLDSQVTRSNDGDQGARIGDVPASTITARTAVTIPDTQLTLRGGVYYTSDRLLVTGSAVELPGYTLVDIGARYQFSRFTLDLTVSNLLDVDYHTASGNQFAVMPGDPRSFSLRFGVAF
ncbi:MAG TPA: TonB-dependent siderophore receptor, partial [Polymorphobacter sp.]|nr:TonB-dependent siderophore receptor [Polymorphobacter sp.]